MEEAKQKLKGFIENIKFSNPIFPIYSNISATPAENINDIPESLINQLISPVLWYKIIQKMISDGIKAGIEIGPGKVLQGLSKRIDPALNMYGAETHQDIVNLHHV